MSALLSSCGQYRYLLHRQADLLAGKPPAAFLMLNPSTADAETDDPTIRRCRGFAKAWGTQGIVVANLYALRATNPDALWQHEDPVGPDNDDHLRQLATEHGDIICAWGAGAKRERVEPVARMLINAGARLWCLGTTGTGAPRHPLYVRGSQPLQAWIAPPPGDVA